MESGAEQSILRIDTQKKKKSRYTKGKSDTMFQKTKPFALLKTVLMCALEARVGVSEDRGQPGLYDKARPTWLQAPVTN